MFEKLADLDIQSVFGSYPRNLEVERPHEQQQSSAGREAKIHQSFFCGRVGCQTSTEFSCSRDGSSGCSTRIGATW
jgi:hypothetical protein